MIMQKYLYAKNASEGFHIQRYYWFYMFSYYNGIYAAIYDDYDDDEIWHSSVESVWKVCIVVSSGYFGRDERTKELRFAFRSFRFWLCLPRVLVDHVANATILFMLR